MLDMTLGAGIGLAGACGSIAGLLIVTINNIFKSRKGYGNPNSQNSFIRRGEHNQAIKSLHQRLEDTHKESKNYWNEMNQKLDKLSERMDQHIDDQSSANKKTEERLTRLETIKDVSSKSKAN